MSEVDIGMGKAGRRAYTLDEVAIVPSRRTRDPADVSLTWEIDAYTFDLPLMASPMDTVVSPATAGELGRLGALAVLNLEGLWTRHPDADERLEDLAGRPDDEVVELLRKLYREPVRPGLIAERARQIRATGAVVCGAVSPQRTMSLAEEIVAAELDMLVIHGTVVSAEHVSKTAEPEPLNLKTFVRTLDLPVIVGGCTSYQAALHLMRTGAAGVLVGAGAGQTSSTARVLGIGSAQATAIADARAARMRHLDETGVYVQVIADGGMRTGGDIAKALVCGADAIMLGSPLAVASEAPGRGRHWGLAVAHPELPRGSCVRVGTIGSLAEILLGPAVDDGGGLNLFGALRRTMALSGYGTLKELQKADLIVTPGRAAT